ncbi:hypothetical protein [Pararhodonellum marinum]|uniref:hypothetical protein n=1 Tax=Pararhodonellum marinum TaxID=2755358 RepID=UPI0018908793|nr:hypothetical protein [Pararhodonellum marinum]
MEKLVIEVPDEKIQMVKQLLEAIGVKYSSFPKGKIKKDILKKVSVWTEEVIEAIDKDTAN